MQTLLMAASFAALSIILSPTPYALAQDTRVARGVVTSMTGNSLTLKVRDQSLEFKVDAKTSIEARGAGTKQRAAEAAGRPGPTLSEVIHVGQPVAVTYHEINGALHASHVRAIAKPTEPGSSDARSMLTDGWVKSIGDRWITVDGKSGGGATFSQTFTIDERTRVFARGASTAARANGGRAPFNALVTSGDRVSVAYEKVGSSLHASDVRVTMKAAR